MGRGGRGVWPALGPAVSGAGAWRACGGAGSRALPVRRVAVGAERPDPGSGSTPEAAASEQVEKVSVQSGRQSR